jgi:hypothetical protein
MVISFSRIFLLATCLLSVSYIKLLPVSPIYILSLAVFFIYLFSKKNVYNFLFFYTVFCYYSLLLISNFLFAGVSDAINVWLGIAYFFYIYESKDRFKFIFSPAYLNLLICASIAIFTFDAVFRIMNPVDLVDSDFLLNEGFYYKYKLNSLLGHDSNFNALMMLSIISLCIIGYKNGVIRRVQLLIYVLLLVILVLSTFSKAAGIALLMYAPILIFYKFIIKHYNVMFILLIIAKFLVYFIFYYSNIIIDLGPSFATKVKIYIQTIDFIYNMDISTLFGVGLHNSEVIFERYAHTLLSIILTESGLIGLMFFLLIQMYILYLSKGIAIIFYIPLYVNGLSYFSGHGFIFMYIHIALAILISSVTHKNNDSYA